MRITWPMNTRGSCIHRSTAPLNHCRSPMISASQLWGRHHSHQIQTCIHLLQVCRVKGWQNLWAKPECLCTLKCWHVDWEYCPTEPQIWGLEFFTFSQNSHQQQIFGKNISFLWQSLFHVGWWKLASTGIGGTLTEHPLPWCGLGTGVSMDTNFQHTR